VKIEQIPGRQLEYYIDRYGIWKKHSWKYETNDSIGRIQSKFCKEDRKRREEEIKTTKE
jgi:hypothetical protein